MRCNTSKLRGKMVEMNMTHESFAEAIGMDRATLRRKMASDGLKFSIGEMHKIAQSLNMTKEEAIEIFLSN